MTLAAEANGLDVAAIHPSKGAKYSPNLHAWLTLRSKKHRAETSRVFATKEGTLYIGFLDDGYLIGSKLVAVLCNGKKEESWAFGYLGELVEVLDFWARYMAVGRCAIDPAHKMHFVGDDTRWRTDGDQRECLWCGAQAQKLRRWVEPVERSAWEPVTANDRVEGRDAASSRRVPSHDGLCGNGSEVGAGGTAVDRAPDIHAELTMAAFYRELAK